MLVPHTLPAGWLALLEGRCRTLVGPWDATRLAPEPRKPGKKRAPKKHGAKFKLSSPSRSANCKEDFLLGSQTVRLKA